jgi:hypothetical protein
MEGKSVHEARRKQQQLDRKWRVGENRAAANQVHFDEEEEHEVSADIFEATVREVLAARMQGEAGCAGLQVLLAAGVEDMLDEQEMQVFQAGAFEAMDGSSRSTAACRIFTCSLSRNGFRSEGLPSTR